MYVDTGYDKSKKLYRARDKLPKDFFFLQIYGRWVDEFLSSNRLLLNSDLMACILSRAGRNEPSLLNLKYSTCRKQRRWFHSEFTLRQLYQVGGKQQMKLEKLLKVHQGTTGNWFYSNV